MTLQTVPAVPTADQVSQALTGVNDPEIHRPITDLGMVKGVEVAADGTVRVDILLTTAGCPLRENITRDVTAAVAALPGVSQVRVELDVMSDEQRRDLQTNLRGGKPMRDIPFAHADSTTSIFAIASGKGGVGKSSVTVNLAAALAAAGQRVGLLDADIYGHSVPRMLGIDRSPTRVENMIMPPERHGVRAISAGMMKHGNEPIPVRGPILHKLLEQFLADVWWGDLDILLLDLPPGTGDVAISAAHLIPGSQLIVVTTPQVAAAEVAERAGSLAMQLHQRVGLLDADIYGHSVPRMLGIDRSPTRVENMIMPPEGHGVRAISAGMMKHGNEPIPVRGPILHKLLEQFLADVWWGDLDILLLDLPPGTGDVAISAAHLIPGSQLIVVTTPQLAAAEVAERAGSLAMQLHQRVVGVIENMSYLPCPHCGERVDVFGAGGGEAVASALTRIVGASVPVLGQVPLDLRLREASDSGVPVVLSDPDSPAAQELTKVASAVIAASQESEADSRNAS